MIAGTRAVVGAGLSAPVDPFAHPTPFEELLRRG